jgi:hypothetical protein
MGIKAALDEAIDRGVELQIKFKNDPGGPLPQGKIERIAIATLPVTNGDDEDHVPVKSPVHYRLMAPAEVPSRSGQPNKMFLPIVFDAEDVLWFTEGPLTADGEKVVVTPTMSAAPGGRTPSGIHIPR